MSNKDLEQLKDLVKGMSSDLKGFHVPISLTGIAWLLLMLAIFLR